MDTVLHVIRPENSPNNGYQRRTASLFSWDPREKDRCLCLREFVCIWLFMCVFMSMDLCLSVCVTVYVSVITAYKNLEITGTAKFKGGDVVRISSATHVFENDYTPYQKTGLFKINIFRITNFVIYLLGDMSWGTPQKRVLLSIYSQS